MKHLFILPIRHEKNEAVYIRYCREKRQQKTRLKNVYLSAGLPFDFIYFFTRAATVIINITITAGKSQPSPSA